LKPLVIFKTNAFPTISETFIVSNIVETIKKGYDVKIIVDTINPKTNTSQPNLLEQYGLLDKTVKFNQPTQKNTRKIKALYFLLNPLMFYYFINYSIYKGKKSFDYVFILKFYWKYRNAKAFHVHFATAINPLFELKQIGFLKSKIVVTFHGYDAHGLQKGTELNKLIHKFDTYVDNITTNTNYLKNNLVAKGFDANKIKIVPIGIDTNFFKNDAIENTEKQLFKIITVGRFVEFKGQSFGIKAIKLLKDKGYKLCYSLVGYGKELNYLEQLVKALNLEDMVHFSGSKNQLEIKNMLKEHQLFLLTSSSDKSGRCETFGVVSLEAQAIGLPVIGFQSGGFPETVIEGETGFIVEDQNVAAMANAIEKFILDENLLRTMSEKAKNHILNSYTFEKTTGLYLKLYE
jgi:colanic acid/amylovoran biosynthesis glycosyltransferase